MSITIIGQRWCIVDNLVRISCWLCRLEAAGRGLTAAAGDYFTAGSYQSDADTSGISSSELSDAALSELMVSWSLLIHTRLLIWQPNWLDWKYSEYKIAMFSRNDTLKPKLKYYCKFLIQYGINEFNNLLVFFFLFSKSLLLLRFANKHFLCFFCHWQSSLFEYSVNRVYLQMIACNLWILY